MVETAPDPEDFVKRMTTEYRERMVAAVDEHYNEAYFDSLGGVEETIRVEFPHTAWREMFFGCLPANRQIHLVYEMGEPYGRDRALVVGLLKQLRDEVKHARVFSNLSEHFGVTDNLIEWEPDHYPSLVKQCRTAVEWDQPHYIASGFQISTEIAAAFMIQNLAAYIEPDYPGVATALRDVAADEGDHVHVGRLIAKRFASPDDYETMGEIAQLKYDAVVDVLKEL